MYGTINRYLIYPGYMRWNNDDRVSQLKEHERRQWLSTEEISQRQFDDFLSMINYAYRHVPFYKRRFDLLQVHPDDIRFPEDIAKLPVLTKKDLQENLDSLVSEACPASQRYRDASGGSTGQPTVFYGDKNSLPVKYGAVLMTDKWTGWKIGEKSAYLWGADREVNKIRSFKEKLVQKFVYRNEMLNAFSMDEHDMEAFANRLLAGKPTLIVAYANAVHRFAQFLQQKGISGISPKGIVSSAETLTDSKRRLIEDTFQCKVLNRYGSREVGLIASECECQQGLHINAGNVYVELQPVNPGGSEPHHEIIVTDLRNRVLPFIRYNTGDLAVPVEKRCDCGRGLPLIGRVTGRTSDFILHPSGKLIHGEYFSHLFYGLSGLVQFQLIQHSVGTIDIRIVVNGSFSSSTERCIVDKVREALGDSVTVRISVVDVITPPPSGKYRFAISHVH